MVYTVQYLVLNSCDVSSSTFHLHDGLVGYILAPCLLLVLDPSLILLVGGDHDHATARHKPREGARLALLRVRENVSLQTNNIFEPKWSRASQQSDLARVGRIDLIILVIYYILYLETR